MEYKFTTYVICETCKKWNQENFMHFHHGSTIFRRKTGFTLNESMNHHTEFPDHELEIEITMTEYGDEE